MVSFLSSEVDKDLLERTFDRLQSEGYIAVTRQEKSGRTIHGLSLTEKGRTFLERSR
jgi:DNA-binding PadR family transcriptional regulator